jgi:hypothetical protein
MAGTAAIASLAAVAGAWLDLDGSTTLLPRRLLPSSGGEALRAAWDAARAAAVAPALAAASWVCLALSAMLLADAVFLAAASLLPRRAPCPIAGPTAEVDGDEEEAGCSVGYPMVLVQIPMYNEREVRVHSLCTVYTTLAPRHIGTNAMQIMPYHSFLLCARRCTSFPLKQHAGCGGRRIGSSYRFSTIPRIRRLR